MKWKNEEMQYFFLEFPLFFQMINRLDLGSTPNHFSKYILLHSQGSVIPDAVLL